MSIQSIVFGDTWVCPDRPAVRPIAFVAPKAGLLSRVSMWEHLTGSISNWELQIWTFVCCHEFVVGMAVRQRGQKQHTGGFVIEALVNMANRPTC